MFINILACVKYFHHILTAMKNNMIYWYGDTQEIFVFLWFPINSSKHLCLIQCICCLYNSRYKNCLHFESLNLCILMSITRKIKWNLRDLWIYLRLKILIICSCILISQIANIKNCTISDFTSFYYLFFLQFIRQTPAIVIIYECKNSLILVLFYLTVMTNK